MFILIFWETGKSGVGEVVRTNELKTHLHIWFFFLKQTIPPSRTRCNTRSIFEAVYGWFSFLENGCLTKAQEPNLLYLLCIGCDTRSIFETV